MIAMMLTAATALVLPTLAPRTTQIRMAATTSSDVIPRDVLFGNPEYASPSISPDGKLLSYLRPNADGVLNIWCKTLGKSDDRIVTADTYRGIRSAFWAEDSKTLMYMQDTGGDENFHLWAIDATNPSSVAKDLTPFPGAKAQNVVTNKRFPNTVKVATSAAAPRRSRRPRARLRPSR